MIISNIQGLTHEFYSRAQGMGLQIDVAPAGAFNASIVLVGEAPGEREKLTGMPFMGGSGQLLWDALRKVNIKRSDVYTTNVVKRQLSMSVKGSDDEKVIVHRGELSNWEILLRWELSQLPNAKFVLVLGNMALQALLGETGINNWRGSVKSIRLADRNEPALLLATYNPAYPVREPKLEVIFRYDIGKFDRIIRNGYKEPQLTMHINPSFTESMQWIDKMQDEKKPTSLDIEVITDETACIGLGNSGFEAKCINLREKHKNRFSLTEERQLLQRFQRFFDDPTTRIVAQNGSFDSYFLWCRDRLQIKRVWFDTLLAHHTLYPALPHNLGFISAQYTDVPFYKDEKNKWKEGGDIDTFWQYNCKDVCVTLQASEKLLTELRQQGLERFFFDHVMHLQPHLVRMTTGGMLIDKPLKDKIAQELAEEVSKLHAEFLQAVHEATKDPDYNPNPRSATQLRDLLIGRLKLVGRGLSTDATNRKRMHDHPRTNAAAKKVITLLDKYKKEDKFLGTYAEMEIDPDGRIRCDWKQYGVQSAPGRLSSSSVMWGSGANLQNQPRRAQSMFIADPDYELWYFDLSQAEARYVGWDAKIDKWKEQFEKARLNPGSYDCHRALAAEMFGIPYDDVPAKDHDEADVPTKRYIAKRCRHGLNYRMGPDRLAEVTGLPSDQANYAYNVYHRITPELRKWWASLEQEARKTRTLYNSYGRRLRIMERIDDNALESIVAFRPQSTIGDKVSQTIYKCHEHDAWPSHARVLLNVHDALVGIARKDQTKSALKLAMTIAEEPIMVHGEPLIIPAEGKISVPGEDGVHRWSTLIGVVL